MSRSGYSEDCDGWALIRYRGAVESAIRGKRGQSFFKGLAEALDSMEEPRLISEELVANGEFCALGVLGNKRGIDMGSINPYDADRVAAEFDIAPALAREVVHENDEGTYLEETPEQRWYRMRKWVASKLQERTS